MALDFSLLGRGPQFGDVLASYNAGREDRKARDKESALALYAQDPVAGVGALSKVDPVLGMKLKADMAEQQAVAARKGVVQKFDADPKGARADAMASGDPEAVKLWSSLDTAQREQAKERAQAIGTAAFGIIRTAPGDTPDALAKRGELFKSGAANMVALGLPQEEVDKIVANPTMAAFDQLIAGSQEVMKLRVDQDNKDRDFKATDADRKADNERADKEFAERARSNRVGEGQAAQRLAYEGARVGIARQAENRAGGEARLKLTEGQAKDGFSAKRLQGAAGVLGQLEGGGKFDPTLSGVGALAAGTPLAAAGVGKASRQYNAAKKEWSDALIRLTTGAAATKDELAATDQTYFPQYGDPPDVVKQKAESRARVERDAMFRAGPGATPTPGATGGVIRYDAKGNRIK